MLIEKNEIQIYDIDDIYAAVLQEFEGGSVTIDLSQVYHIDMSVIQLLIATKQSCEEEKIPFHLQNINTEVATILKQCACEFLMEEAL